MAKTTFAGLMQISSIWLNKVFGQNGHVHDGQDADGSAPVIHYPSRSVAADTVLDPNTDCLLYVDCTAANRAITLPHIAAVRAGRPYIVMKTDGTANVATITDPDGKTISGNANYQASAPYEGVWIVSDGNNWFVI